MSIIAYYVHLTAEQMAQLRLAPEKVWQMRSDPAFAEAELFDMDKNWQVIPWLLSEKKREEQKWQRAQTAALIRRVVPLGDREGFKRVLAEEREKLGVTTDVATTNKMPNDPALIAIEGRGSTEQRDELISFGMGGARVFPPAEVKMLSEELSKIGAEELRRNFNRREMSRWDVGGVGWLQEKDSVLDEFLIPTFKKVQGFYNRAATSEHYVLVICR